MSFTLRWYQQEACDAAWNDLCSMPGNPVIELPTGSGKSVIVAELCRKAVVEFGGRVMVLQHRSELIQQNADKIRALLPLGITAGLYSAGLGLRQADRPIIVAGIQSVYKKAELFGQRHLAIVDEVHLVGQKSESMYGQFLDRLREINPKLRLIGLTATPYRTGEGSVCRANGLFQRICYRASIPKLIEDGYLSPVTNESAAASFDTSKLHIRGGEFIPGEVEQLFSSNVGAACKEIVSRTTERKSILIFCAGVAHAGQVADTIRRLTGEECGVVTGDSLPIEREQLLTRFKRRQLRWLCNVDVLTTGFDAPCIDAIAILRATCSPGLFAQICGRGFRLYEGKKDCAILDFGENLKRHGPLDDINFGKAKAPGLPGDAPAKECPNCETQVHLSARRCDECGWLFPAREANHEGKADGQSDVLSRPREWIVEEVNMVRHQKKRTSLGATDTLRVDYTCLPVGATGGNLERTVISEWVCLEHDGWAWRKAMKWLKQRTIALDLFGVGSEIKPIDQVINLWRRGAVATPSRITTIKEKGFFRITHYGLDPVPEEWSEEASPEGTEMFQPEEIPF
jgi:DNA repair protein RadD